MKGNDIFSPYAEDLGLVEKSLRTIFASDAFVIPMIGEHIIRGGGKRLRPLFLLMSSELASYRGENRILLAGVIEAIHTASLLHDDVVDGAEVRRGNTAAHQIWGNQVVILVGDYCYANALRHAVLQDNLKVIDALSGAITAMTEGEIFQLNKTGDPGMTLEEYYRIVSSKTGALISAACRIGGILGGLPAGKEEALGNFGMKTGIAFQMVDDILDYMAEEKGFGKRLGKDLEEGKITVPLICLLRAASAEEKKEMGEIVGKEAIGKGDLERVRELLDKYGVIRESFGIAEKFVSEAKGELDVFPDTPEKASLLRLADYALLREK